MRDDELPEWSFAALILIVVLTTLLILGWAYLRDRSLARGFDEIADGATQDVLRLMDKPKKVEKCGEFFGPIPRPQMESRFTEYVYAATFAPYNPVYYIVGFDGSGHFISKAPLSSP